jgi:hypothetical protein
VLELLAETVRSRAENTDYDLSRLAMQAWTEALRRPHLRDRTARRWQQAGHLGANADPDAVFSEHLVGGVSGAQPRAGDTAFTPAASKP